MKKYPIPFNRPYVTGKEFHYIKEAIDKGHLSGNGLFTKRCEKMIIKRIGCRGALLTTSCTAALEMAAILANIRPGDEIIMPSYTFVSTANAFVLRGGIPVFVDIRSDTLNIDESKIEKAITKKTRAIVPVHYAGVGCEMDTIMLIARKYKLLVIEDNAQGFMSSYKGRPLGSIGHLAALSFHETKNIMTGEGGALLINDPAFLNRAEIIWEKGTNRREFFEGKGDKYTWVDIGSSFLPSELTSAFLYAQLKEATKITKHRRELWNTYHAALAILETDRKIFRPIIPSNCNHNAHMYYLLLTDLKSRNKLIDRLERKGTLAIFHYIPLHNSPAGKKYGRADGKLPVTQHISDRIVRLPLWIGMEEKIDYVIKQIFAEINRLNK